MSKDNYISAAVPGTNNVTIWKLVPSKRKPRVKKATPVASIPKDKKYI
jgi:hypothetical protein